MDRIIDFSRLNLCAFAFLLLCATILAQAQPPDTLWTRRYGRQYHDIAHSVAQTPDGGFIIAGETWNAEVFETRNADAYVVKVDSLGNEEWSHSWGTDSSDRINKILVLEDGYLAAGTYGSIPPIHSVPSRGWLLRLNSQGDTTWTKLIAGVNGFAWFEDMITAEDGYFIAVGRSYESSTPDLWMVKFDSSGDTLWTRSFGGTNWEYGWAVASAMDGSYVATGYTSSFGAGSYDFWLIKVSQDGDSLWSRTFGFGGLEEARAIALAADGGFFLGGYSQSLSETYDDAWIVRTDSEGNYMWDIDLAGEFQLSILALSVTDDGGVLATGFDNPGSGGTALLLAKVDSLGDSIWARSWFHEHISDAFDLLELTNGGYVAVGETSYEQDATTGDAWLVRLSPDMSPISPTGPFLPTQLEMAVYPNPFNAQATLQFDLETSGMVQIEMYDLLGRSAGMNHETFLPAGTHTMPIDMAGLASGTYWIQLQTNETIRSTKAVLLR